MATRWRSWSTTSLTSYRNFTPVSLSYSNLISFSANKKCLYTKVWLAEMAVLRNLISAQPLGNAEERHVHSNQIYFMNYDSFYLHCCKAIYIKKIDFFFNLNILFKRNTHIFAHFLTHLPRYLMHIHQKLLSKLPSYAIFIAFLIRCVLSRRACHLFWFCVFIMADQLSLYLMDLGNHLMRLTEPNLFLWLWGKIFDGLKSNLFESWIISRCKQQFSIQIVRI